MSIDTGEVSFAVSVLENKKLYLVISYGCILFKFLMIQILDESRKLCCYYNLLSAVI